MPENKDWITPVAVVGGGAALAVGAVLLFKKKEELVPGEDNLQVTFRFDYRGPTENYTFRVVLGRKGLIEFYEEEATRQEFVSLVEGLADWQRHEVEVLYEIPIVGEDIHDVEFSVRYMDGKIVPGMRVIAYDIIGVGS